ncbi:MAG: FMN-binding negative transcriptional regulator [Acidimicrobiales bacterium]|jgi:transcriptional regulator
MYVPSQFTVDEATTRQFLADQRTADLVTVTPRGLVATFLPVLYEPAPDGYGSVFGHVARGNDQWQLPVLGDALMIVHGPDAYISPSWYPSKAAHGRVVPTWDYVTAHIYGRLVVHDDPVWLESLVRRLTDKHETRSPRPWSVDDAPAPYVAGQLRAIVGLELAIARVEAKAKWSQNRPGNDIDGVIEGLRAAGHADAAEAVRAARPSPEP